MHIDNYMSVSIAAGRNTTLLCLREKKEEWRRKNGTQKERHRRTDVKGARLQDSTIVQANVGEVPAWVESEMHRLGLACV